MRDYSKFKIAVRGEPRFASFFLNLRDKELKKRLDDVLNVLKEHPDAGDLVERSLWPEEYKEMELGNLFRMEMGRSQRITYTIRIERNNLDVDVIEFFRTHKDYERKFHYQRSLTVRSNSCLSLGLSAATQTILLSLS